MSQANVEKIIGLLATDEAIRRRFSENPQVVLAELAERGVELNLCERWSLARLDPKELARFAQAIGPRLQKADLKGGPDQ